MISKVTALKLLKRKTQRRLRIKKGTSGNKCGSKLRIKKQSKSAPSLMNRNKQKPHWPMKRIFGNNCGYKLWTKKQARAAVKHSLRLNDIAIAKKHSKSAEITKRVRKLAEQNEKISRNVTRLIEANKKAREVLTKLDNLKPRVSSMSKKRNRLNTQFGTVPPTIPPTTVADPIQVPVLVDDGINNADGQEEVVVDQPIPNIEPENQVADQNIENLPEDGTVENKSVAAEGEGQGEDVNQQEIIPIATNEHTDTIPPQTLPTLALVSLALNKERREEDCVFEEDKIKLHKETPEKSQSTVSKSLGDDTVVSDNVLIADQNQESALIQQDSDQIQPVTTLPNILPQLLNSASTTDPTTKETSSNQSLVSMSSDDPTVNANQVERSEEKNVVEKPAQIVNPHRKSIGQDNPDPNLPPTESSSSQPSEPTNHTGSSENKVVEEKLVNPKLIETCDEEQKLMILSGKLCIFYTVLFLKPKEFWGKQCVVLKEIYNLTKKTTTLSEAEVSVLTELLSSRRTRDHPFETAVLYCALTEFMIGSDGQRSFARDVLLHISKSRGLEKALEKTENRFLRELDNCVDTFIKISLEKYLDYHKNRHENSSYKENPKFEWRSSLPNIHVPAEYPCFKECRLVKEGKEQHTKYKRREPKDPLFAVFYMFLSETTIKSKVLDLDFWLIETAIAANPDTNPMEFEKILFGGIFESYETLDPNHKFSLTLK